MWKVQFSPTFHCLLKAYFVPWIFLIIKDTRCRSKGVQKFLFLSLDFGFTVK